MKKPHTIIVAVFFALIVSTMTIASDKDQVRVQGVVMTVETKKNMMIVNEKIFVWNHQTIFSDDKGSPITVDKLKPRNWVYIEGDHDKLNQRTMARKIYLLPRYIGTKERHLYGFME